MGVRLYRNELTVHHREHPVNEMNLSQHQPGKTQFEAQVVYFKLKS